jgi:hypothetical protein
MIKLFNLENFGVFRVKNHDFTPTNHIFSNFMGGGGGGGGGGRSTRGGGPGEPE